MIKILLVEDDQNLRMIVKLILESICKASVIESFNGIDAFEKIEVDSGIDLIICDYTMPLCGAEPFYKNIKANGYKIPFVLFSGGGFENSEIFKNFQNDHPGNTILKKPALKNDIINVLKYSLPHKFND